MLTLVLLISLATHEFVTLLNPNPAFIILEDCQWKVIALQADLVAEAGEARDKIMSLADGST
jgi:hypothetical protein